jgi:hypothetical protein
MNNTMTSFTTVTWSRTVAPTHGFGMGDVCPQAAAYGKRHLDAIQATPASARMPWSPPVT